MVEEFKVETNSYSAEYGRNLAAWSTSAPPGTNAFHGQLLEFFRNEAMDAKNLRQPRGSYQAAYKRNQFGGGIGGPIRKDRTFFFFDREGTRSHSFDTGALHRAYGPREPGDFSQSILRNAPVRIFDPSVTMPARAPARVPQRRYPRLPHRSVARAAAEFYPLPNRAGLVNNFLYNPLTEENTNKWDIRGDHRFSAADSVYARFSYLGFTILGVPTSTPGLRRR